MSWPRFSRKLYQEENLDFIDTHCHIIPGVDDGPAKIETSIEMARVAVRDGITTIVATPHIVEGYYDGGDREERLDQIRRRLVESGIELNLVAGAEVPMSTCLAGDDVFLKFLAIGGGSFLLMETADTTFDQVAQAAYRVRLSGLYPILAHPERAAFVRERPDRLAGIIERDEVYCQVTAASMEGIFGGTIKKTSLELAKAGMVHLVASDAHSTGKRSPRLTGAFDIMCKELGEESARKIMIDNPAHVLMGEKLERIASAGSHVSNRSILARLLRRS